MVQLKCLVVHIKIWFKVEPEVFASIKVQHDIFILVHMYVYICFKQANLFCRSDTIEFVLYGSLFPSDFPIKDKVKHWIRVFSGFDKVEVKALEKILEQKQRYVIDAFKVPASFRRF